MADKSPDPCDTFKNRGAKTKKGRKPKRLDKLKIVRLRCVNFRYYYVVINKYCYELLPVVVGL